MTPKASVFNLEDFHEIERETGFAYPRAFFLHLNELAAVAVHPGFAREARLLTSVVDVRTAHESVLPIEYIPFLADEQFGFIDYYAFDTWSSPPDFKVVVYARDAVVESWDNFESFIAWAIASSEARS